MWPRGLAAAVSIGLVVACGAPSDVGDASGASGPPTPGSAIPTPTVTATTPADGGLASGPSDPSPGDPGTPTASASPEGEETTPSTPSPTGSDEPEDDLGEASQLYASGPQPTVEITPGQVAVVASGPTDGSSIPVVVHNGLEVAVTGVDITGDILDDGGRTVTRGHAQPLIPAVIPPDGTALARIYAGRDRLLEDAILIDPAITYVTDDDHPNSRLALRIAALEVETGQVTATIANPHDVPARPPITVMVACVDADGELSGMLTGTIDGEELAPGATATLTLTGRDAPVCSGQLAGAAGYATDLLGLGPPSEAPHR